MKFFAHNGDLNKPNEHGSFTIVARRLNEQFKSMGVLGESWDIETYVIYPEVFNVARRWPRHVPYLACEYSCAPSFVADTLNSYKPKVLAISEFAKNNLINSGCTDVHAIHLGSSPDIWYPTDVQKNSTFTYLTVNSSNDRSGFEKLIPAFMEFAKGKDVRLIIKDGENDAFKDYIFSQNLYPVIQYVDDPLTEGELRNLYNRAHLFIYANNTTSFGMTPLDAVLCGTPAIVTLGSALKEFIPEWTQPAKIRTEMKPIDLAALAQWRSMGLNCLPDHFLNLFKNEPQAERVIQSTIREALEYSYANYSQYLSIAKEHRDFIVKNLSWSKTAERIIQTLST